METIKRTEVYNASPEKVFRHLDDLGVTGMHMTNSSGMVMGSKLHLEYLTAHHTGREDEAAQKKISDLITEVYESLPFPVVHVPLLPPMERVEYILKNL